MFIEKGKSVRLIVVTVMAAALFVMALPAAAFAADVAGSGTGGVTAAGADTGTETGNKYNVVFVMDNSGSLKSTDSGSFRNDAVDLFLGLMADKGNYVGSVLFNDKVVGSRAVSAINGKEDKEKISDSVRAGAGGDTDIGAALEKAVAMLDQNRNKELPSVIVLLTDGETDLDNDPGTVSAAEKKSLQKKAEAIEAAKAGSYRIYTLCLNENGQANTSEARQIADATGGEFIPVSRASDLNTAFTKFYKLIYGNDRGSNEVGKWNQTIPASGVLKIGFSVPENGVGEVNVLIEGETTSVALTDPSGRSLSGKDVETTKLKRSENITLKKISDPAAGKWSVVIRGEPGSKINVSTLYNYTFGVEDTSGAAGGNTEYNAGDKLKLSARLKDEKDGALSGGALDEFRCVARFVDADNKETGSVELKAGEAGFSGTYTIPDKQSFSYYITAEYKDKKYGKIQKKTGSTQIRVENSEPKSNGNIRKTVRKWPFASEPALKVDLTALATDKEDKNLTYSIVSSSFKSSDYEVRGNTLVQKHYSLYRGSYTIRCKDSGGLYCDVKVTVVLLPIGLITLILLGLSALIAALVLLIGLRIALTKPSAGCVSVRANYDSRPVQVNYWRGRCRLSRFDLPPSRLDYSRCYFQAEGKPYTTLYTDKPVFIGGRATKEIRIQNSYSETQIHLDQECGNVLFVRFSSAIPRAGGYRRAKTGPVDSLIGWITGLFGGRSRTRGRYRR